MTNGCAFDVAEPGELAAVAARIVRLLGRPPVPVLGGLLLTADAEAGVQATGFTGDTALTRSLAAEVHTPGTVLVSARLLAEVTKTLPPRPVRLAADEDEQSLRVQCGPVRARLPLLPLADYPPLPAMPEVIGQVDAAELATAATQTAHATAAAADPYLFGLHLELDAPALRLWATDRYRLARVDVAYTPTATASTEPHRMVRLEHRPLHETAKAAAGDTLHLAVDEHHVGLRSSHERILLRQLDNKTPPLHQALNRVDGQTAVVAVADLAHAAKRAQVYGDGAAVLLHTTEHAMTLTTTSHDRGDAVETLTVDYTGPQSRIGINPTYLATALAALDADHAAITIPPTPSAALQLTPLANNGTPTTGHVQLIMPLRTPDQCSEAG